MITTWQWLEALPGLAAFPSVWRSRLREDFEPFKTLCLEPSQKRPISFPCPLPTSCAYRIVHEPDGSITGHCLGHPIGCHCIQLTPADITLITAAS
jgi:hypothetical protein